MEEIKSTKERAGTPAFETMVQDHDVFREIMKYNCAGNETTYQEWSDKRKFVADAVTSDGSILDIGCAGGFFLRSLQEWTGHNLNPYGIDLESMYIEEARRLFPDVPEHFAVLNARKVEQLSSVGLPESYDFVYASVFDLHKEPNIEFIRNNILPLARKRLIVGLHASNAYEFDTEEWRQEREHVQKGIDTLQQNLKVSGSEFNPTKFNQAIAWIDISQN